MPPRILVFYGTTDGHTRKVATAVANTLRSTGLAVDLVDAKRSGRDVTPEGYSAVIVAASVQGGRYQAAVRRWVRAHAAQLRARPSAFLSVCLAVLQRTPKADRDIGVILETFFASTKWYPTESKIVAGALLYTRYNWLKRWVIRKIVAKAGGDTDTTRDYEYTDWDDLASFAQRFARSLPSVSSLTGRRTAPTA
jgi:menaquinone-dependent protoporphyrinogen oxidase